MAFPLNSQTLASSFGTTKRAQSLKLGETDKQFTMRRIDESRIRAVLLVVVAYQQVTLQGPEDGTVTR